ncbi:MAG: TlpA family protein disulfide reductase [Bacteroidaceae bacterium]|nr:TlpA family protein disulfide reductase [Bacteroidaceae bacterium]
MKKLLMIVGVFVLALTAQAQNRVIVNPDYEVEEGSVISLVKVEQTDTATTLHVNVQCNLSGWSATNCWIEANGKRYALKSGFRIPTLNGMELKEDKELPTFNTAGEKTGTWFIKGGAEPFVEGKRYTNTGQMDSLVLHFEPFPADVTEFDLGDNIRKVSLVKTRKEEAIADSHILVMPDAAPEQFFDAIAAMFPGKVVFIDLWATWCGPCKLGIRKMGPMKKELKDKDVVFVYITNESSPEELWRKSIAPMSGYHLRMSSSYWDKLGMEGGIPQYYLYDRQGKQVLHLVGFGDGTEIYFKEEILKALEK